MVSSVRVPDDERKGRRLGDDTKGRIADLASGWTVDGDAPPVPEPPIKREASGPNRGLDAPRRKAKTVPPPPPGSPARKALEDKILELREAYDQAEEPARSPAPPAARPPPPPRPRTGASPIAGKPRAARPGEPIDLAAVPEADKTKENRGAVGVKHDKSGTSLTTNSASGTIGGDTPPPLFDRAAIAAGQRGALAGERGGRPGEVAAPTPRLGSPPPAAGDTRPLRTPARGVAAQASSPAPARQGPPARGTPKLGALLEALSSPDDDEPEARRAVPLGEFDHGQAGSEQDKLRGAQAQAQAQAHATIKRDAANALLRLGEPASARSPAAGLFDEPTRRSDVFELPTRQNDTSAFEPNRRSGDPGFEDPTRQTSASAFELPTRQTDASAFAEPTRRSDVFELPTRQIDASAFEETTRRRGDAASNDTSGSSTGRFERGDPTSGDSRDDETAISAPASGHAPTGTLRSSAALPRRRGIAGDLRYVATVVFGLRDARRELAVTAARQATRQQSRRHHLVTLGRAAVTADGFEHAALGAARDRLSSVEDERSQHAGHVVAADAELTRVSRDREARAKQHLAELAALDSELAALGKKLEPLEKEAAGVRKRGIDLHEALRRIDGKIAATEASLDSVKGGKLDRAQVQAEIATLRADRRSIQSDEPAIAGQLDALSPRIAALEAARTEATRKRAELEIAERDDQRRVEELLAAIGAKRKVVDRAASDAEALRDKLLFQLGERLYVDRPDGLTAELAPIDEIDLELGSADRRTMELREILSSVDHWKLVRGIALLAVLVAALSALAGWLIVHQPWQWL